MVPRCPQAIFIDALEHLLGDPLTSFKHHLDVAGAGVLDFHGRDQGRPRLVEYILCSKLVVCPRFQLRAETECPFSSVAG